MWFGVSEFHTMHYVKGQALPEHVWTLVCVCMNAPLMISMLYAYMVDGSSNRGQCAELLYASVH